MNYLCHARHCLDDPWMLAGSILPILVRVLKPAAKLRSGDLPALDAVPGARVARLRRGIELHFAENAAFHRNPCFHEVCSETARDLRTSALPSEAALRAHFLAHVLVEMLLDAWYAETHPGAVAAFYAALSALDPPTLESEAETAAGRPIEGLAAFLVKFRARDYLAGYADDAEVLLRADALGRRTGLPPLPAGLVPAVARARHLVRARGPTLVSGADGAGPPAKAD